MSNYDAMSWQKWVGQYRDRLGAPSKTHLTEDGHTTLCGREVPTYADGYEVSYDSVYMTDCKACCAKQAA